MGTHSNIPRGRISMDTLASRAHISRRQAEHWTYQGWLESVKEQNKGKRGRVHYDPREVRVAFVIKTLLRYEYDTEAFLSAIKEAREWEDLDMYYMVEDRVFLDLKDL